MPAIPHQPRQGAVYPGRVSAQSPGCRWESGIPRVVWRSRALPGRGEESVYPEREEYPRHIPLVWCLGCIYYCPPCIPYRVLGTPRSPCRTLYRTSRCSRCLSGFERCPGLRRSKGPGPAIGWITSGALTSSARRFPKIMSSSYLKKGAKDWIGAKGISKQVSQGEALARDPVLKERLFYLSGISRKCRRPHGGMCQTGLETRIEWAGLEERCQSGTPRRLHRSSTPRVARHRF